MKKFLLPAFLMASLCAEASSGLPAEYRDPVYGFEFRLVHGPKGHVYVGVHEVTQGQWKKVMGKNSAPAMFRKGNDYPVENVNFADVQKFLDKLEEKSGAEYRLPSAAEWKAASGAETRVNNENPCLDANLYDVSSMKINSFGNRHYACEDTHAYTAPVGSFRPNALGLHDMLGNVAEWCCDASDGENGMGGSEYCEEAARHKEHGTAGGSFSDGPEEMEKTIHIKSNDTKFGGLGFRLVIDAEDVHKTD